MQITPSMRCQAGVNKSSNSVGILGHEGSHIMTDRGSRRSSKATKRLKKVREISTHFKKGRTLEDQVKLIIYFTAPLTRSIRACNATPAARHNPQIVSTQTEAQQGGKVRPGQASHAMKSAAPGLRAGQV